MDTSCFAIHYLLELDEALAGRFDEHHAVLASQIPAHIDHLDGQIQQATAAITELLKRA